MIDDYNPEPRRQRGPRKDLGNEQWDRTPPQSGPPLGSRAWWRTLLERETQAVRDAAIARSKERARWRLLRDAQSARPLRAKVADWAKTTGFAAGVVMLMLPAAAAWLYVDPGLSDWTDYAVLTFACYSPILICALAYRGYAGWRAYREHRERYFMETLGLERNPLTGKWSHPRR